MGGGVFGGWTGYVKYIIGSTDPAVVAAWRAQYGNQVLCTPQVAKTQFSCDRYFAFNQIVQFTHALPGNAILFDSSEAIGTGEAETDITYLEARVMRYFISSPTFTFDPGKDLSTFVSPSARVELLWVGVFAEIQASAGVAVADRRRWIDGFELIGNSAEGGSGDTVHRSRDAARNGEGIGFAYRAQASLTRSHQISTFGYTPTKFSWERFYIRLRKLPTANENIWSCQSSSEGGSAVYLYVTNGGAIAMYNQGNAVAPGELLGTTGVLTLNQWYRVDLLIHYRTTNIGPNDGSCTIYLNGSAIFTGTATTNFGLGVIQNHTGSKVGNDLGSTSGLEADVDDWINVEWTGTAVPTGIGVGSRIMLLKPTVFGGSHAGWTGDVRGLCQNPPNRGTASARLTSTTANALLDATYDSTVAIGRQQGIAAFLVSLYSDSGGGSCQLGYAINGGTQVLTGLTPTGGAWDTILYTNTGAVGTLITSLDLLFQKDNSATSRNVRSLMAVAEFRGSWGVADHQVVASQLATALSIHNAPYVDTSWGQGGAAPAAVYMTAGGIYTGNNLGQDVLLSFPGHWFWVRPLAAARPGVRWWSTLIGAHQGLDYTQTPDLMASADWTTGAQGRLRIGTPSNQANASAESYQWIAVADPTARFFLNGAFAHASGVASIANPLVDPSFTPDAAFFCPEDSSTSGVGVYFKGPGHATNAASLLNAAQTATVAALATGSITSKTPLHTGGGGTYMQAAFCAIRAIDVSQCSAGQRGLYVGSYVGDGTASRVLALDFNGRYPLWAMITPHNAQSWVRDPSHTGANASTADQTGASTTAILAGGVDTLTVGLTCNANGQTYEVLVIPGSTTGWDNGEFFPVQPCSAACGPATPWACVFSNGCPVTLDEGTGSAGVVGCVEGMSPGSDSGGGSGCSL